MGAKRSGKQIPSDPIKRHISPRRKEILAGIVASSVASENKTSRVPKDVQIEMNMRLLEESQSRLNKMFIDKKTDILTDYPYLPDGILVEFYKYPRRHLHGVSLSSRQKLAFSRIAWDLLVAQTFEADGRYTGWAEMHYSNPETNYPDFQPSEYTPIPMAWNLISEKMSERLKDAGYNGVTEKNPGWKIYDDYDEGVDWAHTYAEAFEPESTIICLPFTISINGNIPALSYSEEFKGKYGGSFADRLVFVPVDNPPLLQDLIRNP